MEAGTTESGCAVFWGAWNRTPALAVSADGKTAEALRRDSLRAQEMG